MIILVQMYIFVIFCRFYLMKLLIIAFCLVCASSCIPLPQREVNEENTEKYLHRGRLAQRQQLDPQRADANEWARIAEEDMKKAQKLFDAHNSIKISSIGNQEIDSTIPVSSVSKSDLSTPQQVLPESDPVEHADPNHLPAVPIEGDGSLNPDYKAEILLGPEHSSAHDSPEQQIELLTKIFGRIDNNTDEYVDVEELTNWFLLSVHRHMQVAQRDGETEFKRLDTNKDHKLQWHEFESAHLKAVLEKNAEEIAPPAHVASAKVNLHHGEKEGNHEHGGKVAGGHQEHMTALRLRWMRADENGDDALSLSEFSSFHHPEQHPNQLKQLSKQLMASFDLNNDGQIHAWEFEAHTDRLPEEVRVKGPGSVMQYTNEIRAERKHQFELSDSNKDGVLSLEEVEAFLDPQNIQHAQHEAEDIIKLADNNGDGLLTLREMMEKAGELLSAGRRLCDPAEAMHDTDEL